jgi:hypothetical protein
LAGGDREERLALCRRLAAAAAMLADRHGLSSKDEEALHPIALPGGPSPLPFPPETVISRMMKRATAPPAAAFAATLGRRLFR